MSYYDRVSAPIAEYIFSQLSNSGAQLGNVTADTIASWYRDYMNANPPTPVALEDVAPDFEEIYTALQNEVIKSESWRDASVSSTGNLLLSAIAAGIEYNMAGIIRAAQETMLDTARAPNSVYAIARMLGVRLLRKRPVSVVVSLSNNQLNTIHVIPAFTQFSVGTVKFFNRDQIVFNEGQAQQAGVVLHQGLVVDEVFSATGEIHQRYEVGLPNFTTADEDIECFVNDVPWTIVQDGLWRYPKQKVVMDRTTAKGTAELIFGNGQYGEVPVKNSTVRFVYARTEGTLAANATVGLAVKCLTNAAIKGLTTTGILGGGDERDHEFYRLNASTLFAGRNKAVTAAQYKSLVLTYDDVIDCSVLGQQLIDPNDPKLFNQVYVSVLTASGIPWATNQWNDFEKWLRERSMIGVNLVRKDPSPVVLDVTATIYCKPNANLQAIKNSLEQHLSESLKPSLGSIGRNVYKSDVYEILTTEPSTMDSITHVKLAAPSLDISVNNSSYVQLRKVTLTCQYGERSA